MEQNIVKNRYLSLDGTPSESAAWRRYISPWTLAAAFTSALITYGVTDGKTEKIAPVTAFAVAAASVVGRGSSRKILIDGFERAGLNNFVIDTKPETKKHACTDVEMDHILKITKENANWSAIGSGTIPVFGFARPSYDMTVIALPIIPSFIAHAFEGHYLANKLQKNEWIIVGRGEMQRQEDNSIAPSPT